MPLRCHYADTGDTIRHFIILYITYHYCLLSLLPQHYCHIDIESLVMLAADIIYYCLRHYVFIDIIYWLRHYAGWYAAERYATRDYFHYHITIRYWHAIIAAITPLLIFHYATLASLLRFRCRFDSADITLADVIISLRQPRRFFIDINADIDMLPPLIRQAIITPRHYLYYCRHFIYAVFTYYYADTPLSLLFHYWHYAISWLLLSLCY